MSQHGVEYQQVFRTVNKDFESQLPTVDIEHAFSYRRTDATGSDRSAEMMPKTVSTSSAGEATCFCQS